MVWPLLPFGGAYPAQPAGADTTPKPSGGGSPFIAVDAFELLGDAVPVNFGEPTPPAWHWPPSSGPGVDDLSMDAAWTRMANRHVAAVNPSASLPLEWLGNAPQGIDGEPGEQAKGLVRQLELGAPDGTAIRLYFPVLQKRTPMRAGNPRNPIILKRVTKQWVYVLDADDPSAPRTWRTIHRDRDEYASPGERIKIDGRTRVVLFVGGVTYAAHIPEGGGNRVTYVASPDPRNPVVGVHKTKKVWEKIPIVNLVGDILNAVFDIVGDVLSDPDQLVVLACGAAGGYAGGPTGAQAAATACGSLVGGDTETAQDIVGAAAGDEDAQEGLIGDVADEAGYGDAAGELGFD